MSFVYALKLLNNKFYIAATYDLHTALKLVFTVKSQKDPWLIQNKPMYVDKVIENCEPEDEYKLLRTYIRKYGVDNVRGPTFDAFVHEQETLREILEKIKVTNISL